MRFLARENVPGPVEAALRAGGHDVLWVKERMAGAKDRDVLARAQADARLVVTFAVRSRLPSSSGVVLFRLHGPSPDVDNARAVAALTSRDDWAGHFAVVTDDRVRLRPLPRRS